MLILARKICEKIVISDEIIVTILAVKGNQVRLGIDAPIEIPVHRYEVFQRIQAEKQLTGEGG